jgi:hypothetical protein
MNTSLRFKTALATAALLALPFAHAATLTKAEYGMGKTQIGTTYKADKATCDAMSANAKDICVEQAKAREKVALAELEFSYTAKPADQNKILVVQAETAYSVAKEKCDDLAGNPKDVCVKEAKATRDKALADAKLGRVVGAARSDASKDKVDADYSVATEKCDALAGDAKAACIGAAKARFGKT